MNTSSESRAECIKSLRERAEVNASLSVATRGQDIEDIAVSSCYAGRAQAYNSVANRLEAETPDP